MRTIILTVFAIIAGLGSAIAQDWQTDFSKAKELASKENKTIVLVFQGSDWCAPCIKLDKAVWSTEEFKRYSKDNYVMVQADFPKKKQNALSEEQTTRNSKLADTYNKNGIFPFVVVLDKNGKVLGETSYKKLSPEQYIAELNDFIQ